MGLSDVEILGLFVLFEINFIPIVLVFLTARNRYMTYIHNRPAVRPRNQAHLNTRERGLLDFTIRDQRQYDAYRAKNQAIVPVLPYTVYLVCLLVTAGVETAGTFLVWYDRNSYSEGIYYTYMAIQFVTTFLEVGWVYFFFDTAQFCYATWAGGGLAILTFTNTVIVLQDNPGATANWFTNGWVTTFYIYSFLLALVFCHTEGRNRYHRVNDRYTCYDFAETLLGRHVGAERDADAHESGYDTAHTRTRMHGYTVAPENRHEPLVRT